MQRLIENMMRWLSAGATARAARNPGADRRDAVLGLLLLCPGNTPIEVWNSPTVILYPELDNPEVLKR